MNVRKLSLVKLATNQEYKPLTVGTVSEFKPRLFAIYNGGYLWQETKARYTV